MRGSQRRLRREAKERKKRLDEQKKAVNMRAKYGPDRKPGVVVIRRVADGEVVAVVEQAQVRRGRRVG